MNLQAWVDPADWRDPNRWAVYSHSLPGPGPVADWPIVWVGYCRAPDVLTAPDARNSAAWLLVAGTVPTLLLTVHGLHENGNQAMRDALRLIRKHRPRINSDEPLPAPGNTRRVRCMETEELFDSAADVCRKYGIHKSQFSVYMSRRDGKKIRGLTFVYC